jgi:hypothetical protein
VKEVKAFKFELMCEMNPGFKKPQKQQS